MSRRPIKFARDLTCHEIEIAADLFFDTSLNKTNPKLQQKLLDLMEGIAMCSVFSGQCSIFSHPFYVRDLTFMPAFQDN